MAPLLLTHTLNALAPMNVTLLSRTRVVGVFLALAAFAASQSVAEGQLCLFLTGPSYLQNFNTLPASGTTNNSNSLP